MRVLLRPPLLSVHPDDRLSERERNREREAERRRDTVVRVNRKQKRLQYERERERKTLVGVDRKQKKSQYWMMMTARILAVIIIIHEEGPTAASSAFGPPRLLRERERESLNFPLVPTSMCTM
jgi:hypothetical protein